MQIMPIQSRRAILAIDGWPTFWREGEQFLATAEKAALKQRAAFTPEVLYNLVAMAIEKLIMAYLMSRGDLAENHTMADLIRALEKHQDSLPDELVGQLLELDGFQEICDLDQYLIKPPQPEQVAQILATGRMLHRFLAPQIKQEVEATPHNA